MKCKYCKNEIPDNSTVCPICDKEQKRGFFGLIKDAIVDLFKHPVKLIPPIVISVIWLILSILSATVKNIPILRFFCGLTFANGGMFGGFFGAVGGIFAKAVFACVISTFVYTLFSKQNPFKGIKSGLKMAFNGGLKSISPFLIGSGIGILLCLIFNMTQSTQNCAITIICALAGVKALSGRCGLLFSLIFFCLEKGTKGKAPSQTLITRIIAGLTIGFMISFPITFIRLAILPLILGVVAILAGVLIVLLGSKKTSTAIFIVLILVSLFSVIKLSKPVIHAEDSTSIYSYEEAYRKYRGRLTYSNGRKNKYGQPFPDLMDFDKNGAITWFDYDVQRELSHDPDLLKRPAHTGVSVFIAVMTSLVGTFAGTVGAIAGGIVGTSSLASSEIEIPSEKTNDDKEETLPQDDLGPYIKKDAEGDLVVKDPVTGEERLYIDNGDGTYTNPLTDATYTKDELKESLESRAENKDILSQDEKVKNDAINEQRSDAQGLSELTKDLEHQKALEDERNRIEEAHDVYVEKQKIHYGTEDTDEIRNKIAEKQTAAEIESYEQLELEKEYEKSQKYAENVKKASDVAIDVLAEIEPTGAGKVIKDEYTVLSAASSNIGEVMAGDKSLAGAITQTVVDSAVGLAKNHAGDVNLTGTAGYAEKAAANIVGDGIQATSNELMKGKSLEEAKKAGSKAAIEGATNFAIDSTFDALGAKFGSDSDSSIGSALGSEISKKTATEGTKALGADIAKNALSGSDDDKK